ncbi:MAG: GTPase [Bacteroidetes bacterium]|nr:MAG: GTPase [Bacteroidota bacterium]
MPDYLTFLNYLALFLVFFIFISFFYGLILLCDIPYKIAKKRNHPQQDAIQVAGWVSLFTLQVIWPFLWIWATLYREDRGWGVNTSTDKPENLTANNSIAQNTGGVS